MSDDPRVQKLLEEMLESHATPEEVCASCVELLPVVRERWRRLCHARAELEAMFPPEADANHPPPEDTSLPVIPGYEVESVLGLGGMGVVFRARHLRLNRVVALKMALAGAYGGPHERERFQREAEAVASLRHPNVVQIHEVGDSGGRPYFTMEYVEGGTLAQKLAGTPLPAREAAVLLATLAGAVHSAHASGIVHRDLKPANVLLTSDGTPKISDFGLARRLSGEAGLTRTGAAMGTPSYMAPEQARGAADAAGPAADVYALGAILYELLTGRPPFRAETGAETIQQVLAQDPVPPSRLNGKVPRDLETICLKCLHKDPRFRYATAAALADDVHCFLRGESIAARPEGGLRRLARKVRRRPALSAAIAVSTLFALALAGGGLWVLSDRQAQAAATKAERAAVERAADEDLNEMEDALRKSLWPKAKDAWARANTRLEGRESPDLRRRLDQGARDRELADRLNSIERDSANTTAGRVDVEQIKHDYEAVFRERFGSFQDDPKLVAERIAASNVCNALVAALDYWAAYSSVVFTLTDQTYAALRREKVPEAVIQKLNFMKGKAYERLYLVEKISEVLGKDDAARFQALVLNHTVKTDHLSWLLAVAREAVKQRADNYPAERDSTGWTYRARDPENWKNEAEFTRLLETAPVTEQHAPLLMMLAQRYRDMGKNPIPFLLRIQQAHPGDFTVNTSLGLLLLHTQDPRGALRYYQAALAIRPWTALAHDNLGVALAANAQYESAIEQHRIALRIDPTARSAHFNLAIALSASGAFDEAIKECNVALRYYPENVVLYGCLARCLEASGRDAEAVAPYRKTVQLQPLVTPFQTKLRALLIRLGHLDEARQAWQLALDNNPPEHDAWYGYAEFCLFLGKEDEYRRARKALLGRFGTTADPQLAERTGRACLLQPASGEELRQAVALADRAMSIDQSKYKVLLPSFTFVKGLADFRQGRFEQAISAMRGDASRLPGPTARLILAMSLFQTGKVAEARHVLGLAILAHDWRPGRVRDQDGYICHALRREAEKMILPNLTAFVEGKYQPREIDERIALLGLCQFTDRSLTAAQCYADVFVGAPPVAENFAAGNRYLAACAATRAGCGKCADAAHLGDSERAKWRTQARAWLRADLAAWSKALGTNLSTVRDSARQRLSQWQGDPDLAGLREPAELTKLHADERKDCLALWTEVSAVLSLCEKGK